MRIHDFIFDAPSSTLYNPLVKISDPVLYMRKMPRAVECGETFPKLIRRVDASAGGMRKATTPSSDDAMKLNPVVSGAVF